VWQFIVGVLIGIVLGIIIMAALAASGRRQD
jgi:purine-cytosine permease-like protein